MSVRNDRIDNPQREAGDGTGRTPECVGTGTNTSAHTGAGAHIGADTGTRAGTGSGARTGASAGPGTRAGPGVGTATRVPYAVPRLERLGAWSALTLQQTVPIFP